jgi:hypothetical protein
VRTSAQIASTKEVIVDNALLLQYLQVNMAYCEYNVCQCLCLREALTGHKEHKPEEPLHHANSSVPSICISVHTGTYSSGVYAELRSDLCVSII